MTEDQLEQEALGWLAEAGYETLFGPDIAPDGERPERADYLQVLLPFRLREAIHRLNPDIPYCRQRRCAQASAGPRHPGLAFGQSPFPQNVGWRRAGGIPEGGRNTW